MAGVTYISSSGIVAKVLADLGRLGNRETPVVLSILVFEDLAMAVYLPILTAVLVGVSFLGGLERGRRSRSPCVAVVLVVALRYGRFVSADRRQPGPRGVPAQGARLGAAGGRVRRRRCRCRRRSGRSCWASRSPGPPRRTPRELLEPLRDLFAAVFFVVFGLNTDPTSIPPVLGWAVVLAVATTVTKLATGWWAAQRQGIGPLGRARAGAALIARGEFSIVIAGLAVSYAAVPNELAALATAYVLLMAVIGPIAARVVEPVTRWVRSKVPVRSTAPSAGLLSRAEDRAKAALGKV